MSRGLPLKGDVLFTTEAPLGEVAQVTEERIALAQRVLLMRGKQGVLNNNSYVSQLKPHLYGTRFNGVPPSTVKGIRQKELRQVTLPIPPIEEQYKFEKIAQCQEKGIEVLRKACRSS